MVKIVHPDPEQREIVRRHARQWSSSHHCSADASRVISCQGITFWCWTVRRHSLLIASYSTYHISLVSDTAHRLSLDHSMSAGPLTVIPPVLDDHKSTARLWDGGDQCPTYEKNNLMHCAFPCTHLGPEFQRLPWKGIRATMAPLTITTVTLAK